MKKQEESELFHNRLDQRLMQEIDYGDGLDIILSY